MKISSNRLNRYKTTFMIVISFLFLLRFLFGLRRSYIRTLKMVYSGTYNC